MSRARGRFIDSSEPPELADAQAAHEDHREVQWRSWHRPKDTPGRAPGETLSETVARLCGELAAACHDRDRYAALLATLPLEAATAGDGEALARWVLDTARRLGGGA